MKKVFIVAIASMVLFGSCVKSRTCTCTYADGSAGYSESYNTTKKDAQAQCDDQKGPGKLCSLK